MNFCEMKEGVSIIGKEGGAVTGQMVAYLKAKGLQVALYSVSEAASVMPLLVTRGRELPLALETGYDDGELLELFHASMRCGMHLMPVGNADVWENMVPLELPEMSANPVFSPESDWFVPEADEDAESENAAANEIVSYAHGISVINGTTVSTHTPDLKTPLADLNEAAPVAPPVQPLKNAASEKKKQTKKQNHFSAVMALLCVMLTAAVVLVGSVLMLHDSTDDVYKTSANKGSRNAPVPPPVRVWLNDCHYCRERMTLVTDELLHIIIVLKSDRKALVKGTALNDLMLKVAMSVNNGTTSCNKCRKLNVELNKLHSAWHAAGAVAGKTLLDWKLARVGNETYKKIQVGAALGCYTCKHSLEEELVKHACPNDGATSDAFKPGADIDCAHCREMLKKKLQEEHVCPPDNNRAKLAEGEKLGCEKCAKRKTHECPNPKTREGLQAGADISCPLCQKNLDALTQHECPKNDHETQLKKGTELGCELCAERYAKVQKIKKLAEEANRRARQAANAGRPPHSATPPHAPHQPQQKDAEPDRNQGLIRTIDGQRCPSNPDVKAGRKLEILENHAAKGCARCKENYAWRNKKKR